MHRHRVAWRRHRRHWSQGVVCIPIKSKLIPEGCHCDDAACWCGPEDAYTGPDDSGLPLLAREAEDAGAPCDVSEVDGIEIGDCSGWYSWICDADVCADDLGNTWSRELIRPCFRPCSAEFGGMCVTTCKIKPPAQPQDCDPSTQSCRCDPAVSSCP